MTRGCWCSHAYGSHDAERCRLCIGSPYSQARHRYQPIEDLPPLRPVRGGPDSLDAILRAGHVRLTVAA